MGRTDGKIIEQRFAQTQARTTMLVVDPRCGLYSNLPRIRMLAGTIAQMALQRHDPVGLVIGTKGIYLKPSHAPAQLTHVLKDLSESPPWEDNTPAELLEQSLLRRNLPYGAEIVLISPLDSANEAQRLEKIAKRFRTRGVTLTIVKMSDKLGKPKPKVEIGGVSYPINEEIARNAIRDACKRDTDAIKTTLRRIGGRFIDIATHD